MVGLRGEPPTTTPAEAVWAPLQPNRFDKTARLRAAPGTSGPPPCAFGVFLEGPESFVMIVYRSTCFEWEVVLSQPGRFRQIIVQLGIAIILLAFCQPSSANVIYVMTLTDKASTTGGCSLKEAIYSSTLHDTLDGVHGIAIDYTDPDHFITTQCKIGGGNDTILYNEYGTTTYTTPRLSPFVISNVSLAPGPSTSFALQFLNPANEAITYTTRVLAGPGVI
jgi:hypothetical protein